MTSLTFMATEAHRLLGSQEEQHRPEMQEALTALCEKHWLVLRGPKPTTPLAQALWEVTPPWSDLMLDLCAESDPQLMQRLPAYNLAKGLALLVLAEIERGNEAGAHLAYEPMMAIEETPPPKAWLKRLASLLRGTLEPPLLHKHDSRDAMWKAMAVIATHTHRLDLPAVIQVIDLLITTENENTKHQDQSLETLRQDIKEIGIRFLGIEDDHVQFQLHGHPHKPIRTRQLGEMLQEIRQKWLQ